LALTLSTCQAPMHQSSTNLGYLLHNDVQSRYRRMNPSGTGLYRCTLLYCILSSPEQFKWQEWLCTMLSGPVIDLSIESAAEQSDKVSLARIARAANNLMCQRHKRGMIEHINNTTMIPQVCFSFNLPLSSCHFFAFFRYSRR